MTIAIPAEPLTGDALLARVKQLGSASKAELARGCGYAGPGNGRAERTNYAAFYEALLAAKGVSLGKRKIKAKAGRVPTFSTKVLFHGGLMVGSVYTSMLGLRPGDRLEIRLGSSGIRLVQAAGS